MTHEDTEKHYALATRRGDNPNYVAKDCTVDSIGWLTNDWADIQLYTLTEAEHAMRGEYSRRRVRLTIENVHVVPNSIIYRAKRI